MLLTEDSDNNKPEFDKPTIQACMSYYCCNPSEYCNAITTSEKIARCGKCLFTTGLAAKSCEFCLFTCCNPYAKVNQTCKALWFPSCKSCSTTSDCLGGFIDWPLTIGTFSGPILWITSLVWDKLKKEQNNQL